MKHNFKFVDSFTNQAKGISEVTIRYKGKLFKSWAKCHPDDEWSEFVGCGYAETRARLKALQTEYYWQKRAYQECVKFVKAVEQYKNFDASEKTAKVIYRQLNRRKKELDKLQNDINELKISLKIRTRVHNKAVALKNSKED